jgi:hypothetical protein
VVNLYKCLPHLSCVKSHFKYFKADEHNLSFGTYIKFSAYVFNLLLYETSSMQIQWFSSYKHNIKTIPQILPHMCITVQGTKIILRVIYFSWEMLTSLKCDHVNLPGLIEFIIPLQYMLRWHNLTSTNLTLLNHRTAKLQRHITSELKHNQFFPLEGNFLETECALKSWPSLGNHANDWLVIIILHILV